MARLSRDPDDDTPRPRQAHPRCAACFNLAPCCTCGVLRTPHSLSHEEAQSLKEKFDAQPRVERLGWQEERWLSQAAPALIFEVENFLAGL